LKKSHKVIILAGIPGSGKSTYIEGLMKTFSEDISVSIVSADHYFIKYGTYKYVAHDIPHAHKQCQNRFSDALDMDVDVIFVDNTNILSKHRKPYVQEALDCGYEVEIHALPADVEASASRNIHGVDLDVCQRMFDSFDLEFGTIYDHKRQKIGTITKEQVGLSG
jgi:tRNA uridine 5-carbamoylmethylation protein Kti12